MPVDVNSRDVTDRIFHPGMHQLDDPDIDTEAILHTRKRDRESRPAWRPGGSEALKREAAHVMTLCDDSPSFLNIESSWLTCRMFKFGSFYNEDSRKYFWSLGPQTKAALGVPLNVQRWFRWLFAG